MLFDPKYGQYLGTLEAELRRARGLTPELMSEVMAQVCGCFAPHEEAATRGIRRLIEADACVDAVLALIALELPQWTLRRVLYEDGEWHCSLSRQPQLPIELDEVAEGSHEALPLAVLIALLHARRDPAGREGGATGVPPVNAGAGYTMCCDNFA
jgi:hypothetical protein